MAETAFILSPDKIVLLPDIHAGCPMVDMVSHSVFIANYLPKSSDHSVECLSLLQNIANGGLNS